MESWNILIFENWSWSWGENSIDKNVDFRAGKIIEDTKPNQNEEILVILMSNICYPKGDISESGCPKPDDNVSEKNL